MDAETVKRLLEINQNFYSQFSADFSGSRSGERFNIEPFRKYMANDIRLLDAGCGNGRLADTLERAGYNLDYLGIDGSADLVRYAGERRGGLRNVRAEFRVVDLTQPNWGDMAQDGDPFDVVVSLAVLHHIPSFELRAMVLTEMGSILKPGGKLVLSNWQFMNDERLRRKVVGWDRVGIDESRVETGDYLLDWKRGGLGTRYVHLFAKTEMERLAKSSRLQVVDQFYADNDMNFFSILAG